MKEWNVYINGAYVGTVHERNEGMALLAAFHKFDIGDAYDTVSVSVR